VRIARVLTRLNLGGPARQALASDPLLRERGHTVRLFTGRPEPGEGDLFAAFEERGIDVVRVPGLARKLTITGDFRAARFLAQAFAEFAPDVVHTHASKAGLLGRRAAQSVPEAACVHTFHGHVLEGYFPPTISKGLVAAERRLAARTRRIVAVSHSTADDLLRLGVTGEDKLVVVPPGVDLDALLSIPPAPEGRTGVLRSIVGADADTVLVGVLGRLAEVKQPERAVAVFELLAERHPELQLAFIGDGTERGRLERRIRRGGDAVQQRVHLVGARPDVPAVLADLDALLLTSRAEGLPVALIEAAAAGIPVVAAPVGGVPEIVVHERTGFLGETTDELAYHLAALLADSRLRRDVGHRARLRVQDRHSAPVLADKLEELYRVVTAEAP
jgi:glycosyltransferase involved in cell wall biosynthesis